MKYITDDSIKVAFITNEQDDATVAEIDKKLEDLQKQLLRLANSKEDYNDIADEIYRLREEKNNALAEEAEKKAVSQRLIDMVTFLKEQPTSKKMRHY